MTRWLRIFGSLLIALGVATFVCSIIGALFWFIYGLFAAQDYVSAVTIMSLTLIIFGAIIRKVFKDPLQEQ